MNKRTLRILEYNKILEMLSEYAASSMAKKYCLRMKPQRELAKITALQEETRDALIRINKYGSVSFAGLTDIGKSIKLLEINSSLSASELLSVAAVLETAGSVKKYAGENDEISYDSLTNRFSELMPLSHLSTEIRRCILAEDEIADDASSRLKSIRRSIKLTNDSLHQKLAQIIKSNEAAVYLQDNIITMRNGRYCVPVKQEYRAQFPGMIHDRSQSGSTLFIEPMQVVNLNNEIKELANQELMEIERILVSLSEQAASYVEDIAYDVSLLTELDFIFARAKFARSYNGSEPVFNEDGIIDIRQGRHPLLDKHTVVPVDIKLGEDYNLLIITGPNTGGKTVSLKTLGLFSLMGQAGLHIPALYGSRLNVFQDVFADIGDEQSIEQNLSTFSSHMKNIVYIINHAGPETLCLFDEPGGGTDPVEGAALAVSILSYLKNMGARVMATTHYSELKTFALSTDGVENASCEFDVATLRPTYRLLMGIPGKSNAFAISKKLGLPDYIIEDAKNSIDSTQLDMETLISDLEKSRIAIEEDRKAAENYKAEIETLKRRLAEKEEKFDKKKTEILDKAREEARSIIEEAKETADATIRDYNKWRTNPNRADLRKMEEKRSRLREKMNEYDSHRKSNTPSKVSGHKPSDYHIGDEVLVISLNTNGHIVELPDSGGNALVQMGILTSRLPISDLLIVSETNNNQSTNKKNKGTKSQAGYGGMNKSYTFKPEINLLGKTVDEAITELDKFLDDAMLSHASQVTIIHGKGTGALRRGIHDYLSRQKYVKNFRAGEFGEGDAGVTIVEF